MIKQNEKIDFDKQGEIRGEGECILVVNRIHPKHETCIVEDRYYSYNGKVFRDTEGIMSEVSNKNQSQILAEYNKVEKAFYKNTNSPEYNHKISIVGESEEELLQIFFKKKNSLTYCNGTDVYLENPKLEKAFKDYFYGEKGIGNYAKFGGNMD